MKRALVLVMVSVLFVCPLAMAGDLGSSDSEFLFSSEQVTATTISAKEMQDTQGKLLDILSDIGRDNTTTAGGNAQANNCLTLLAACTNQGLVQVISIAH